MTQWDGLWKDVWYTLVWGPTLVLLLRMGVVLFLFTYVGKQVSLCFSGWFLTLVLLKQSFLSQQRKAIGMNHHTWLCQCKQELLNLQRPIWKKKTEIIIPPSSGIFTGDKGMEKSQRLLSTKQFIPAPEVNASQASTQITNYVFRGELIILEQGIDIALKIPRKLCQPKAGRKQMAHAMGEIRGDFNGVTIYEVCQV